MPAEPLTIATDRAVELALTDRVRVAHVSPGAMVLAALVHFVVPLLFLLHWPAAVPMALPKPIPVALIMAPPPEAPATPPPAQPERQNTHTLLSGPGEHTTALPPAETVAPEHASPPPELEVPTEAPAAAAEATQEAPSAKPAQTPAESSSAKQKPRTKLAHLEPAPKETAKPQAQSLAPLPRHANIQLGDKNEAGDPYLNRIMAAIEAHRIYPTITGHLGLLVEGTTVYAVLLDRSGNILDMRLARSSGTAGIDSAAESMIRRSGPFPPIPAGYPDKLPLQVTLHLMPPS
jgi:periplasmic protein TonB